YADHRMVMAAAVLGLAIDGVQVADPGAVTKTLPDFRERWAGMLSEPGDTRTTPERASPGAPATEERNEGGVEPGGV
ncbi:hypothetical protein ACQ1ZK_23025, partial [Enterococcus faecium]